MERKTLKDIAKDLNLSISTVSKALSDSYEISQKTKSIVKQYALKHHYIPNKIAQTLKTGKTYSIGVIVFNISNTFISQVLDGIHMAAEKQQYDIIIMQSRDNVDIEKHLIDVLKIRGIDGLLISPVSYNSNYNCLKKLQELGIPVVIFDRINHELKTHKVGVDNFNGAYLATKHLIENGKRKILHITARNLGVTQDRFNGFKKCLKDHHVFLDPSLYIECDYGKHEEIEHIIKTKILACKANNKRIDAIFGATDEITTLTIGILAELNIKVPEEIAVIGFSNIRFANALNPALSTIVQPTEQMGRLAFEKLIEMINTKHQNYEYQNFELDSKMIVRKSSL